MSKSFVTLTLLNLEFFDWGKSFWCIFLCPLYYPLDYNLHHVCVYVRAWVTQISLKLLQLHIVGKLLVLMNFYALQYFWGLVNFGLILSE